MSSAGRGSSWVPGVGRLALVTIVGCASGDDGAGGAAGTAGAGGDAAGGEDGTSSNASTSSGLVCEGTALDCDGDAANGCEVDSITDPAHCGSCGHDCRGGTCEGGRCGQAILAEDTGYAGAIALDDTHVFLATSSGVVSVPKSGGDVSFLTSRAAASIAVDGDAIDLVEDATILRVPKLGGASQVLHVATNVPGSIAVGATDVFFTQANGAYISGTLARIPRSGGARQDVAAEEGIAALTADQGGVFWLTCDFQVRRLSPEGAVTTLATMPGTGNCPVYDLPTDGTYLYFGGFYDGTIHRVARDGSSAAPLFTGRVALTLAANATELFWTEGPSFASEVPSAVWSASTAGGEPTQLLTIGEGASTLLAADDGALYGVDSDGAGSWRLWVLVR